MSSEPLLARPTIGFPAIAFCGAQRLIFQTLLAALSVVVLASTADGQNRNPNRQKLQQQQRQMQRQLQQRLQQAAENQPQLPSDPQLLSLHREFMVKAEKLAAEYERKKQFDQARSVYESMVRLVPKHPQADAGLQRIMRLQSMKDRKVVNVSASDGWQDSGIQIQKGMPVHLEVKGTWKAVLETGPEGVPIPDDMKFRDSKITFGSLIGAIAISAGELEKAKPFVVKPGDDFVADQSGHLFFRMYDVNPADNEGTMLVLVQSTFGN